jgi:molecular chaperone GrpE
LAKKKTEETPEEVVAEEPVELEKEPNLLEDAQQALAQEHDNFLRLAAEYDNFRKRSAREKDCIYVDAATDTVKAFLSVYDNLSRAVQTQTADDAYKKGVEMTMAEMEKVLASLGVSAFGAVGESFDPSRHNAVMHMEDESLGENTIAEVFQPGFLMKERVIRFAMVKVAN